MNYYMTRELLGPDGKGAGLWKYTCKNDEQIWPVGYCAADCPGHATAEEARAHQKEYELDHARYVQHEDVRDPDLLHRCQICGCFTAGYASWGPSGMSLAYLCAEHCKREELAKLVVVGYTLTS